MSTLGIKSWAELNFGGQKAESTKTEFMRLEQGSNIVRVVTNPFEFLIHRYKPLPTDKGFGDKVMSCFAPGRGEERTKFEVGIDPLFDKKFNEAKDDKEKRAARPQSRWYVGVIEKKTSTFKLMEASYSLVKGILTFAQDPDWGDPKNYYIDIKVDKNGGPTGYYSLVAKPNSPLSLEELNIIENIDLEAIAKRCAPITAEQQKKRLADIDEKYAKLRSNGGDVVRTVVSSEGPKPIVATESEEDLDFDPVE